MFVDATVTTKDIVYKSCAFAGGCGVLAGNTPFGQNTGELEKFAAEKRKSQARPSA